MFSNYNLNDSHPMINREQTFLLDRKMIAIHSEDRDIKKWPNSNHFEVTLPEDLVNVRAIRLNTINIPDTQYVFSNNYQNTCFFLCVTPDISGTSQEEDILNDLSASDISACISEGSYTADTLASELTNALNNGITNAMQDICGSYTGTYDKFSVEYNTVKNKLVIGNTRDNFSLKFSTQVIYNTDCGYDPVWNNPVKWGLPYYLGYEKDLYLSTSYSGSYRFSYDTTIERFVVDASSSSGNVYVSEAPCILNIGGEEQIYIELDRYNSIDEIAPYSQRTNNSFNNDYHGRTNSAFARVSLFDSRYAYTFDGINNLITNKTIFNPPLPKLRKLKFKFRYHDGRLVEFKKIPFSFSLLVDQLLDEQKRNYIINDFQ